MSGFLNYHREFRKYYIYIYVACHIYVVKKVVSLWATSQVMNMMNKQSYAQPKADQQDEIR